MLTLTEVFNLASQAVSDFMVEGNRHLVIPAMAENTSKIINSQQENIEEQAQSMWNRMFPKVKEDLDGKFPDDYPEEYKEKIMKDDKLREQYGI